MIRKIQIITYLIIIMIVAILSVFIIRTRHNETEAGNIKDNFNLDWASDPLWDDGKAEVAFYQAERSIYGKVHQFEYVFILVKETFNEEYHVKTDDYSRNDLFEVMKINKFARIRTQYYPYHFLSSLYLLRDDPVRVHKFTNSSQEWCGNTFKHFTRENTGIIYFYDSYWDGEGRGSTVLPMDVLFEDQLMYTLRTLKFENSLTFGSPVVESQVTNRARPPEIYEARITVSGMEDQLWEVRVDLDREKQNLYWFSTEYPNRLQKMVTWDGRKAELDRVERKIYWPE